MHPYHIIGIIAFSTLVYASLVTGLVWLGMSLFYSMICLYASALWVMVSMQQRAKQECAGRDRRYRTSEIPSFGPRVGNSGFTDQRREPFTDHVTRSLSSETNRKSIGRIIESGGESANYSKSAEVRIRDVREYAEHLHSLRRLQRRSNTHVSASASATSASQSRPHSPIWHEARPVSIPPVSSQAQAPCKRSACSLQNPELPALIQKL